MLYHLIYVSKAKPYFSETDFVRLLFQSRINNSLNQITGLLLYHAGGFMQYIEGSRENVLILINKIQQDDRHYDFKIIAGGPINQRHFQNWSMQYQCFADGELEQMLNCKQIANNNDAVMRAIKLIKLFSPRPTH